MTPPLSSGALEVIMSGGTRDNAVMQILGSKKMSGGTSSERYRLLISDGKYLNSFAMLATQLNEKVDNGELTDFTIVRLNRVITSMVNNAGKGHKRVMIILDITPLTPGSEVGVRLGNPVPYEEDALPSAGGASEAAPSNGVYNHQNGMNSANGPTGMMTSPGNKECMATHPIMSLNPYQNHWTIKARCTAKSAVKTWSNARSEGKLFSMEFLDESGDIRCTAFKESVDKFYDLIEIGKVYFISNCQLKTSNKNFTQVKHDYEMTINQNTIIVPCMDAVSSIPTITYDFTPIEKVEDLEDGAVIDVIGICNSAGEVATITAKSTGKEFTKRDICLIDETKRSVTLTLWSEQATEFDPTDSPVVAVKGARLKMFNGGKTLSMQSSATMLINPDIPQSHRLRGWFENEGHSVECKSVSTASAFGGKDAISATDAWCTLEEMKVRQLGTRDVPDYITVKASIITTRHERALYQACPSPACNKKVVDMQNGMFRCEKCNCEYENFKYRLLTRFNIGDHSTNQFVNCFQEQAESILNIPSQELGEMEQTDPQRYEGVFTEANFQSFVFKLRVKMETYNDTSQLKVIAMVVQKPIDYKSYNLHLLKEIKRMKGMIKPEN